MNLGDIHIRFRPSRTGREATLSELVRQKNRIWAESNLDDFIRANPYHDVGAQIDRVDYWICLERRSVRSKA